MIPGRATPDGTERFADESGADRRNYKTFSELTLSNVGIGTYLGEADDKTDRMVTDAIVESIKAGINVIDTAINYRSQKAERSVGEAIRAALRHGVSRDQLFISTKNGYVTNDADVQLDFWEYVREEYVSRGIIREGEITSSYHCMTPSYLADQLDRSLKNLGLECVDLMYVHNAVEGQVKDVSRERFLDSLAGVFEMYESKRNDGKIAFYGMATWECFRVPAGDPQHLSMEEAMLIAAEAGGEGHGFRFVQLPLNMYYDQALLAKNQTQGGDAVSALEAAARLGLGVFTSVPFMQGRLLQPGVMPEFADQKPPVRALQFLRSAPGVLAPLVGQKSADHVAENMQVMSIPPSTNDEFSETVKKLTS